MVIFSRNASTSWVMEGFGGFLDWHHILSIKLGCLGAPCSGSPSAAEGARSAAVADNSCHQTKVVGVAAATSIVHPNSSIFHLPTSKQSFWVQISINTRHQIETN